METGLKISLLPAQYERSTKIQAKERVRKLWGIVSNKIEIKKKQFIRIAFFLNIIINTLYSPFVGGSILESYWSLYSSSIAIVALIRSLDSVKTLK